MGSYNGKKRLTVIVPSYNFENYIEECIDSIFLQKTNFGFDVIVRDDCSTDSTQEKIECLSKKYPDLIILDGSKNIGGENNVKLLLDNCKHEYVSYIDGDDIMSNPDKLQLQVDFLDQNRDYVMHFTGCKYLYDDGDEKDKVLSEWIFGSLIPTIKTEDLIETNNVAFGRTFRNIPELHRDYFYKLPYGDWPFNFEASLYGLIKCENFIGGHYRISKKGKFSTISDEQKIADNRLVSLTLRERFNSLLWKEMKVLTIIDCFVHNDAVIEKLESQVDNLKRIGCKILLISNTSIPESIQKKVDFFVFNSRNLLFSDNYESTETVDLWKNCGHFTIHNWYRYIQKHGLSVMCNLFNSLDLAKSLGFTHFQRIEVDDLYTDPAYEYIYRIPGMMQANRKKAIFYFNGDHDVSFHYFFSEIDYFLDKISRITNENDYKTYLEGNGFGGSFINVERYLRDNLDKKGDSFLWKKNGSSEMKIDFEGTIWNTETSISNSPDIINGCSTKIYKKNVDNGMLILSFNTGGLRIDRKILVHQTSGRILEFYHSLENRNSWQFNYLDPDFSKIEVFDLDGNHLYSQKNEDIMDIVEFH